MSAMYDEARDVCLTNQIMHILAPKLCLRRDEDSMESVRSRWLARMAVTQLVNSVGQHAVSGGRRKHGKRPMHRMQ